MIFMSRHHVAPCGTGGVGPKKYSAQDGELLILLLGHFAWFSHTHAREIIEFGGHTSIVEWLTTKRFKGQANALDDALAFPLHRACLCTLASICRHGIDTSNHVLELDGVELALQFATHLEAGVRCCALRLLARLISYAAKRHPQKDSLPLDSLWPIILVELRSNDELLRTVAGACALEAIANGCVPVENGNSTVPQSLALALLNALELAADADSSAAALPLLIAVNRMAGDEDELIHGAMRKNESLIPLMTDWLPKATRPMAVATAKAAGLSAACTLRLLRISAASGAHGCTVPSRATPLSFQPELCLSACAPISGDAGAALAGHSLSSHCSGIVVIDYAGFNKPTHSKTFLYGI
jgi:hypothetical protein